jgi:hypothetical protein
MTVRNTNYSSLDEVWGDTQAITSSSKNAKRKDKREKRERFEPQKVVDPICELYEMGNYRGYNENDIINYANEYHDKYFEKEHNRPHANINRSYEDDYENEDKDYKQQESKTDTPPPTPTPTPTQNYHQERPESYRKSKVRFVDDDEPIKEHSDFAFIDLLLYIVSGIILIFVMEQFVKIGLLLQ